MIDVLALMIDISNERNKTASTISKAFGISVPFRSNEDVLASSNTSKEFSYLKQVIEMVLKGNLPFLNED